MGPEDLELTKDELLAKFIRAQFGDDLMDEITAVGLWEKYANVKEVLRHHDHCTMCREPLGRDDVLPYHTMGRSGKDCTPSCMYCAKVFGSKQALEEHEAGCI